MFTKTELAAFHRICDSLGTDLKKYQEWVDYDMKRYGKVSDKTRAEIEKAGLEIIKSRYGDYEVIAKDSTKDEIKVKAHFGGWHKVSKEQAKEFVKHMISGMQAVPETKRAALIEEKYLRGITVAELLKDSKKDAYNNGIILERLETYKGRGGEFTVVKVKRDNGRIQYVVTSDKWDIDAGDKMPGGTVEDDLASAIKTAKEYATTPPRKSK